jgi:hypothetical protein
MPEAPGLAPHHLAMLAASEITQDVIAARGYFTATTKAALEALGFGRAQRLPGLVIPVYNVYGELATYILRPDIPRIPYGKSKPAKYEFMYGARMALDVPRLSTLHQALGNPQIPLWITEGSKKVDALVSQGCCAVAVLGVWSWRGTNEQGGTTALPDWEAIALNARTVYVVYDSDVMLKDEVHQALARIGAYLQHRKAHVRYLYLPAGPSGAKIGIDDYFAAGKTVDAALALATTQLKKPVHEAQEAPERWLEHLSLTAKGQIKATYANYVEILTYHPAWSGRLTYNSFTGTGCLDGLPLSDHAIGTVAHWFGITLACDLHHLGTLQKAVHNVAAIVHFDPLLDYLRALEPWDGTPRLMHWLTRYAGAEDSAYTAWVGATFIAGLLTRALTPGSIMRYCLILEGKEGAGKSALVAAMGGAWASTMDTSLETKEAQIRLRGVWVMELPELDALSRSQESRIKSFISTTTDTYVRKYENEPTSYPRRTCFIGSTNEGNYLGGQHGNTRFLPMKTGEIDAEGFSAIREQLYAEGMHHLDDTPAWWVIPPSLEATVARERSKRVKPLVFLEPIAAWITEEQHKGQRSFTMSEILTLALGITEKDRWPRVYLEVSRALHALGWESRQTWDGDSGTNQNRWYPVPKSSSLLLDTSRYQI